MLSTAFSLSLKPNLDSSLDILRVYQNLLGMKAKCDRVSQESQHEWRLIETEPKTQTDGDVISYKYDPGLPTIPPDYI